MFKRILQSVFRQSSEKGSLGHVLARARRDQEHKQRQLILTYQAVNNPSPRFSISISKKVTAAFLTFVLVVTAVGFIDLGPASGASFTFEQTDWAGGTDGGIYPVHPGNQTGWNKYDSKDAGINAAAGNLALTLNNGSNTQTTDADFNAGTRTNVVATDNALNLSVASAIYRWSTDTTTARADGSFAWDSTRNRMYVFGSNSQDSTFLAYTPSTNTWTNLTSAPAGRQSATMSYDSTNDRVYVYGGRGSGSNHNTNLWSYDPVANSWSTLSPTGTPPAGRHAASSTWDPVNGKFYIAFGDRQSGGASNELWSYTPSTNAWTSLATGPAARQFGGMAWDSTNNQVIIHGGYNAAVTGVLTDLWTYNPANNTWTQRASDSSGATTAYVAVGWDPGTGRFYAFGGRSTTANSENNTLRYWTAANNTWTTASPSGTAPAARHAHYYGMDGAAGKFYIFGGVGTFALGSPVYSDTFSYSTSGNSWTRQDPVAGTSKPSARQGATGVWDPTNSMFYLFGGTTGSLQNDLWSWSGSTGLWTQLSPSGGPPGVRTDHVAVWDTQNNKMWIFGGNNGSNLNDLWSYTPSTNTWAQLSPSGPPTARSLHTAVWDSTNNKMWIYGGSGGTTTLWSYTPSTNTWAQLTPTGGPPTMSIYSSSAWDSTNNKMWVFAGGSYTNQLWSYTPSTNTWAQLTPTGGPPTARNASRAVWDATRSLMYVNSGHSAGGGLNDTWAYDPAANTWTQLTPVGTTPTTRHSSAVAWDNANKRMVMVGGFSALSDLQLLSLTTAYSTTGDLISSNVDTGQNSVYGNLTWSGNVPANTVLRFQLRSATTSGGLSSATWYGPTGTGDYYTSSGTAINSIHNGHRWVQYRAYLSTTDTSATSTLNDLTVNFSYYSSSATLTGSAYDSGDSNNVLARIEWTEVLPTGTDVRFQVRTSTVSNGDYLYALRGNSTTDFYRYSISGNSWTSLAPIPTATWTGVSLVSAGGDYLYATRGNSGTFFYRYSISGNSWSTLTSLPGAPDNDAKLAYPGYGDFLYILRANNTGTFYRYSISGNSWTTMATVPVNVRHGSTLISTGGDYLYSTTGNDGSAGGEVTFYRYSISGNSWTQMANAPVAFGSTGGGAGGVYPGTGDYLYIMEGDSQSTFLRYSISGNSWSTLTSLPGASSGGSISYPGSGDYMYVFRGGNATPTATTDFYRYSISGNSWTSMASVPAASWVNALAFADTWTSWMGPDGTSSTYFTDPAGGETMPAALADGVNDQWIQYKAFLSTTDNSLTPTLSDLTLSYVVNGAPTVTNVSATQGSNGVVTVGYDLTDSDSANATVAIGASFGVTLSGGINNSVTSLTVSSAVTLPASGSIFIDNEEIQYASKTDNTLNTLTRGRNNSIAATHSDGAAVFFKAATVSGNAGAGITPGTGKSITWTIATDLVGVSTSAAQVKVFANDGNLANQQGSGSVSNITLDTANPSTGSATSVKATATASTAVTITWTTDEASDSLVDYGSTVAYGTTASNAALTTSHSVSLTGLTAGTAYYFRVRSTDAFGNTLTDDNGGASFTFTTPASDAGASRPIDETPPVITNVVVSNIATNGVTITWLTDEESSSIVNYGLTNTYGNIAGVPDIFVTNHQVVLSGLIPGTVYNYQVVSLDRNSNRTASVNATFTTATGTGSGTGDGTGSGTSSDILEEQVNELLNENTALNTQINELNAKLGSAISEDEKGRILRDLENLRTEIDNNIRKISELSKFREENEGLRAEVAKLRQEMSDFTSKILGLKEGESLSAGDLLKMASRKFNELARVFKLQATVEERGQIEAELTDTTNTLKELTELVPPPRVMTRPAIEVTSATATITWTTDKPTYGSVLYGDDATFRVDRSYVSQANDTNGVGTSHSITLTGLAPATLYHYQIAAKSEAGAETNSADFTFTTKTASPIISNGRVVRVNDSTLQVLWQTTLPSNSVVTYTPYVNGVLDSTQSLSEGKPEPTINHNVTVAGLKPATTYDIEISSTDAFGNTVTERLGRIVTSEDKIAPVISQVRTEISVIPGSQNRVQVIISWRTDEPGTTQVFYAPGAATGAAADKLSQVSNLNNELTYNHIAVITNWEPGVIYRFRAISKDETGNEAQSKTFTVLTPRQKATVVDLIIDNFTDIFGWTKGSR